MATAVDMREVRTEMEVRLADLYRRVWVYHCDNHLQMVVFPHVGVYRVVTRMNTPIVRGGLPDYDFLERVARAGK